MRLVHQRLARPLVWAVDQAGFGEEVAVGVRAVVLPRAERIHQNVRAVLLWPQPVDVPDYVGQQRGGGLFERAVCSRRKKRDGDWVAIATAVKAELEHSSLRLVRIATIETGLTGRRVVRTCSLLAGLRVVR